MFVNEVEREIHFLNKHEVDKLLESTANIRHKLIVLLMLDCGMRVSETIRLRIGDFDFRNRFVYVQSLKKRSQGVWRKIPLSERLYKILADYLYTYKNPEPHDYLFPTPTNRNQHITRQAVNNFLTRIRNQSLPIRRLHPHALRHTFATQHISQGTPLENIKTMLGHKSYDTTLIYSRIPDEILKQNVENVTKENKSLIKRLFERMWKSEPKTINIQTPVQKNFLVGRINELNKLNDFAQKGVNTIITGDIGVGKTHLINNITSKKKMMILDDLQNLKKSLVYMLVYLYENDKQAIKNLIFGDYDTEAMKVKLNKESIQNLAEEIIKIVEPKEYILKIDNVDRITPKGVKILEQLKDAFTIITTAREISLNKSSFLWNFEVLELKNMSRFDSLQLIQKLSYDLEIEDYDLFKNHVYEQSAGNPRVIFELIDRYKREPFILNETVRNIRHHGALKEYDFSIVIILLIASMAIMRYLTHEVDNYAYRFIGGAAMILLIFSRTIFTKTKRKFF